MFQKATKTSSKPVDSSFLNYYFVIVIDAICIVNSKEIGNIRIQASKERSVYYHRFSPSEGNTFNK